MKHSSTPSHSRQGSNRAPAARSRAGPSSDREVGQILGDMSAVDNGKLSEEDFATRHPGVITAAEGGAVRAFCPEGAQGEVGRTPRGGAEVGCYLRDMMSDVDEVYAGRMTKPEFDARHGHVVGADPRAASLKGADQALPEGTRTPAPLLDRHAKADTQAGPGQIEERLAAIRAERKNLFGRRDTLDSPSAGRAGKTTKRENLGNNVALGRGQTTLANRADKATATRGVAQDTAKDENSGRSAARGFERYRGPGQGETNDEHRIPDHTQRIDGTHRGDVRSRCAGRTDTAHGKPCSVGNRRSGVADSSVRNRRRRRLGGAPTAARSTTVTARTAYARAMARGEPRSALPDRAQGADAPEHRPETPRCKPQNADAGNENRNRREATAAGANTV